MSLIYLLILLLIYSPNKYLLWVYHILDTILGNQDTIITKLIAVCWGPWLCQIVLRVFYLYNLTVSEMSDYSNFLHKKIEGLGG